MKVEGIEIEWWDKERFRNRTISIMSPESPKTVINVPNNVILCDCCNSAITDFPVAVWGSMAYCKECFGKYLEPNIEKG